LGKNGTGWEKVGKCGEFVAQNWLGHFDMTKHDRKTGLKRVGKGRKHYVM
jgi:hypothetical protein